MAKIKSVFAIFSIVLADGATRQAATLIQQWIKLFLEGKR
jgi:hypothetical protein